MIEFTIRIAGQTAAVQAIHPSTEIYCKDYLCSDPPELTISVTQTDIEFERKKSAQEDALEGKPVRQFSDAYLETIAVQRKFTEQLFLHDTILFHGSVVAVDHVGYLFTAKSGTGKSTHTRLWREVFGERAVMINDDKPFLQIAENGVIVHGSPWNGKHGLGCNASVPLKAICLLERGQENVIRRIMPREAVTMLMQQSSRPMQKTLFPKYLELIDRLAARVDFYRMACNMDPQAAVVSYEGMNGKDDNQ